MQVKVQQETSKIEIDKNSRLEAEVEGTLNLKMIGLEFVCRPVHDERSNHPHIEICQVRTEQQGGPNIQLRYLKTPAEDGACIQLMVGLTTYWFDRGGKLMYK